MFLSTIDHVSHEHMLQLKSKETKYRCNGCREIGFGSRYRCKPCDYDLHQQCALAEPYISHPFYENCDFEFFSHLPNRVCDACCGRVEGFVYHCKKTGFDLHPLCASLPHVIGDGVEIFNPHPKVKSPCHVCGKMELGGSNSSWSYLSTCQGRCLHVSCVKDLFLEGSERYFGYYGEVEKITTTTGHASAGTSVQPTPGNNQSALWKISKRILKGAVNIAFSVLVGNSTALVDGLMEYVFE